VTFAVLATGPSMSQEVADYVKGKCRVIAVSDAYRLAPWADALCSQDGVWWEAHPEAKQFAGRRFSTHKLDWVEHILPGVVRHGTNSGLLGMEVARLMGAKRILLLGFDMHGSHYFGPHPAGLKNTTDKRFQAMQRQFTEWKPCGVDVINCTPGSRLRQFRASLLEAEL